MKYFVFLSLVILVSCSESGDKKKDKNPTFTSSQIKAKELIQKDIQSLQNGQYGISQEEINLLREEGLISEEELVSLKIVK